MAEVGTMQTRRDRYREETRADLSRAAFDLAKSRGLANVRVPDIAAAAGVSTRTFNNYFSSKEEAIAWPATARAQKLAAAFRAQPTNITLRSALIAATKSLYEASKENSAQPEGFQALIESEPALYGEYLKAQHAAEQALANALAQRMGDTFTFDAHVLAAMVTGAEKAAVLQWSLNHQTPEKLSDMIGSALEYALAGLEATL